MSRKVFDRLNPGSTCGESAVKQFIKVEKINPLT